MSVESEMMVQPRMDVQTKGQRPTEPLIFEKSVPGQQGVDLHSMSPDRSFQMI